MKNFISITPFLAIIVILIFLQRHLVASPSPIQQKVALFQFKQSLSITTRTYCFYSDSYYDEIYRIPSYPKTMNWSMSSDHCTWEGVSCEHGTGDVIGLDLSCSGLGGAILPNSTLFQLSHLRFLNLSQNNFYLSSEFPQEIGSFAKGLTHLNLSDTRFSGRVPSGISHLSKLVSLDLSGNFDAKLENEAFKSILQNLTQLRVLNLELVNISSVLPVNLSTSLGVLNLRETGIHGVLPQEVFHLPNIEVLVLGSFYGEEVFPSVSLQAVFPKVKWGSSGTLQHLFLLQIDIYGGIPDSMGFLESLVFLNLPYCNLSGPIPRSIGNLSQLTYLSLSNNNLNGPIPRFIGNLGQLTDLGLGYNNLNGPIPRSIGKLGQLTYLDLGVNNLNGPITTLLANLTNLRYLSLSHNSFTGPFLSSISHFKGLNELHLVDNGFTGLLPTGLFNHPSLEELDLSYNGFTGQLYDFNSTKSQLKVTLLDNNLLYGPIPQSFSQLVNLIYLDLSSNNFSGILDMKVFSRLESVENLDLSHNNFSGVLDMKVFSRLESLEYLVLSHNSLLSVRSSNTTTIPPKLKDLRLSSCNMKEFPHFSRDAEISLRNVDLSNNEIEGEIPHWIGSVGYYLNISHNRLIGGLEQLPWNNIHYLDLQSNKLNGSLPALICNSSFLEILNLSNNTLSGVLPICQLVKLTDLDLSSNNISVIWDSHFSRYVEISLHYVDLSNNEIEGEIPHWIGLVGDYLNISHNRLTGGLEQLPWNNIQYLDLQSNKLNGSLPALICNSSFLEILNLSNNTLSGVLPICRTNLHHLSVFDLRMNGIQGSLPSTLSNFRNLKSINLHGNKLGGRFPPSFAEFDKLETLDLGSNQINDTFPQCLEALPNLQVLVLKSNKFHGIINMISNVQHPFPSLRIIDLSCNKFSGPLPIYFENFKAMMNAAVNEIQRTYMGDGSYYSDSTSLVIKGVEIELVRILTVFTAIDVSGNVFEGKIVEYIGNLVSLRYLNLSHNHLTGHIPSSIGKLLVLESLDLSFNRLEGEIPQLLSSIYTLARLNLSFNQLRGHIPVGSQLSTFENDSYVGNLGLCGYPLSKQCVHNGIGRQEEDEKDDCFFNGFTWEAVVIGYGCGVVPAFIAGYLMLLAGKPKWFSGIIARELGLKIRRMEIKWR